MTTHRNLPNHHPRPAPRRCRRCGCSRRPSASASGTRPISTCARIATTGSGWHTDEQDILLRLTSLFQAGEEAVTLDLLPLILVIAQEGRLEEEMFLTTFPVGGGQAHRFLQPLLREVAGRAGRPWPATTAASYHTLFYEALPGAHESAAGATLRPQAQIRAVGDLQHGRPRACWPRPATTATSPSCSATA